MGNTQLTICNLEENKTMVIEGGGRGRKTCKTAKGVIVN